jgi:hypothetical protein
MLRPLQAWPAIPTSQAEAPIASPSLQTLGVLATQIFTLGNVRDEVLRVQTLHYCNPTPLIDRAALQHALTGPQRTESDNRQDIYCNNPAQRFARHCQSGMQLCSIDLIWAAHSLIAVTRCNKLAASEVTHSLLRPEPKHDKGDAGSSKSSELCQT